jgi:hypothetical protein
MDLGLLKRHRYLILLITLSIGLLTQLTGGAGDQVPRELLISIPTIAVFFVVFDRPRHRQLALWSGVAALLAVWAQNVLPPAARVPVELAHNALMILLLSLAVAIILRHLFERKTVGVDAILGTICGYILLGVIWANLYAANDLLVPNSFSVVPPMQTDLNDWDGRHNVFTYFSLVTLTTVGYGDVAPTRGPATALALLEAIAGQFYIAVVVAQLVGARLSQAPKAKDDSAHE